MTDWIVRYEVREPGAIGIFEWMGVSVTADSEEKAKDIVRSTLYAKGYETRGVKVTMLDEDGNRSIFCDVDK